MVNVANIQVGDLLVPHMWTGVVEYDNPFYTPRWVPEMAIYCNYPHRVQEISQRFIRFGEFWWPDKFVSLPEFDQHIYNIILQYQSENKILLDRIKELAKTVDSYGKSCNEWRIANNKLDNELKSVKQQLVDAMKEINVGATTKTASTIFGVLEID